MAFLQNILNTIKRNTLDKTNIDEKIGGFVSNLFHPQQTNQLPSVQAPQFPENNAIGINFDY